MNKKTIIAIMIITAVILASCAAGPNAFELTIEKTDKPAGFLLGVWHGFISLFTFIISLFSNKINIYEVYNNGGWYNFGFIVGISIFYGGGSKGTGRRRRRD